jgi:hypothetical protein
MKMEVLHKLSSRSVLARKKAIQELKNLLKREGSYMAVLSLRYMAEHDPAYTVRNTARAALYMRGLPADDRIVWDKAYAFGKEEQPVYG